MLVRLPFEGVVFDCDGVLVDSFAAVDAAWRDLAAEYGLPADDLLPTVHGVRAADTLARWVPAAELEGAIARLEEIEVGAAASTTAVRGAVELVGALATDRWGVATSGTRRLAEARLRAAGIPPPPVLVTADDVRRGKPHPDPYLAAARGLGVAPQVVVVFEDAPSGAEAAHAAGASVVAVATTHPVGSFAAVATVPDLCAVRVEPGVLVIDPREHS